VCQQQQDPEKAHFESELAFVSGQLRVVVARLEALQVRQQANGKSQTAKALERAGETLGYLAQDVLLVLADLGEP
jgi:hypothetical protein